MRKGLMIVTVLLAGASAAAAGSSSTRLECRDRPVRERSSRLLMVCRVECHRTRRVTRAFPNGELYQLRAGFETELLHHAVLVKRHCSRRQIQDGRRLLH
jgi:hypothetical protein